MGTRVRNSHFTLMSVCARAFLFVWVCISVCMRVAIGTRVGSCKGIGLHVCRMVLVLWRGWLVCIMLAIRRAQAYGARCW